MKDVWAEIPEFPGYSVSNRGLVLNDRFNRLLAPSLNQRGVPMVGLMKGGTQHKRSVAPIVAAAFLALPEDPRFDSVICLDGNREHTWVYNLAWRPQPFAIDYHKQFTYEDHPRIANALIEEQTEEVFDNSWHATITFGVLERAVVLSVFHEGFKVWPTGHKFRLFRN